MPHSVAASLVSGGISASHHSDHHLSIPEFIAAILKYEVIRSLHKLTQCGADMVWFVMLQKKKAGYFIIKPCDSIQTNSEVSLHRKRHFIITKSSQ